MPSLRTRPARTARSWKREIWSRGERPSDCSSRGHSGRDVSARGKATHPGQKARPRIYRRGEFQRPGARRENVGVQETEASADPGAGHAEAASGPGQKDFPRRNTTPREPEALPC